MPELPILLPIVILALTTVIAVILYLYEYNKRRKLQTEGERMLEDFRQKGLENLQASIQKSQDIIGSAEMEGIKIEEEYSKKLSQLVLEAQQAIAASSAQIMKYMEDLKNRNSGFEEAINKVFEQRINQMFGRLEEKLSDFLISTEQKTTESIELELKASRNLIEGYKTQQLKLIDENIIAMMEQTLNIVLAKKLTLKDQLELVYEALEKAKIDKFIV